MASSQRDLEAAIAVLRGGRCVLIGGLTILSVETGSAAMLAEGRDCRVILTQLSA